MNLSFTDEQRALKDLARQILEAECTAERLKQAEASPDWYDAALWGTLAGAGLAGVGVAEVHGGSGGGILEVCVLLEEIGRTVAPVPAWATLALGALPLARFGSPAQQSRWLPGVAAGDVVLTATLPEPDPSDPVPATVRARDGALVGAAGFVAAAHLASRIVVPADGGVFLADPAGAEMRRATATSGEPRFEVVFDSTPAEPLTDNPAAASWMAEHATVALCALQVGLASQALHLTAAYVSEREQFGRRLATFQAVQQRAADAYIDVEAMRWTMWQAAWRLAEGLPAAEEVAIAKWWAADGGQRVCAAAQHLHGGVGVDVDYPLHRYTLWSKVVELSLGGAARQQARLGALMAR